MTSPAEAIASFHVLGPVALRRGAGVSSVPTLTQPRPLAVLSYLVLARPRRLHSRDTLLTLLWPESDQARGRHALRNVLHSIRKAIGEEALVAGGDALVGVVPGSIACDALEVEALVERKEWEAALALYQGDLLSGFHVSDAPEFEEWLYQERTRFRDMMVTAAAAVVTARQQAGDLPAAIRAAERRVQLAPDEESGQRQLMQLLAMHGERAAALRVYERLEERVRTEYDATPSRETRELLRELRHTSAEFARPVAVDRGSAEPAEAPAPIGAPAVKGRSRRWYIAAGVVCAVAAAGALATRNRIGGAPPPATLFVAPVANATGDSAATWLGDGLTISLRDQFQRAGWRLVPESQVRRAMKEHDTPGAAARSAGAALLLVGSADSSSGRVRLHFDAVPVGSTQPVASAEVLVQPNRLLDAELAVVRDLIEQLRPGLAADSLVTALRRGTDDATAYRFLLQGWYAWDRRFTLADMERASAQFDSALAHDPFYADALAARARVRFAVAWSGPRSPVDGMAAARADARRAVELDSTSRVALSVLGALETFHDSAAGRRLLERAVALDPDRSDTYFLLGLHYGFRGEYAIAERAFRRAVELEPSTPFLNAMLIATQVCQGKLDEAVTTTERWRATSTRPELQPAIDFHYGWIQLARGEWRSAMPALRAGFFAGSPSHGDVLAQASSQEDVERMVRQEAVRQLTDRRGTTPVPMSRRFRAVLAMRAGRRDEAVKMLTEARLKGDVTVAMTCEDPVMAPLLRDPVVAEAMRLPLER